MWSNEAVGRSRSARLLGAVVVWFGGLLVLAILSDVFDAGPPKPVHAEGAPPAFVSVCFRGAGGELLDFTHLGQRCR
jgi:hypothetical protein